MGEEIYDNLLNVLSLLGFEGSEAIAGSLRRACQVDSGGCT